MREFTSRGAAIDIEDFERRLRGPSAPRETTNDPLSELARLMQGDNAPADAHRFDRFFSRDAAAQDAHAHEHPQPHSPLDEDAFAAELRGAFEDDRSHAFGSNSQDQNAPYRDDGYSAPGPHDARAFGEQDAWPSDNLDYAGRRSPGRRRKIVRRRPQIAVSSLARRRCSLDGGRQRHRFYFRAPLGRHRVEGDRDHQGA